MAEDSNLHQHRYWKFILRMGLYVYNRTPFLFFLETKVVRILEMLKLYRCFEMCFFNILNIFYK